MKIQYFYILFLVSLLVIAYQNCADVRVASTGLGSSGSNGSGGDTGSSSFNSLNKYFSSKTTHVCAGDPTSRTVRCWGRNSRGQLGNGTQTSTATPPQLFTFNSTTTIQNLLQVIAGNDFTCVLIQNGEVHCSGRLCDGTLNCSDHIRAVRISQSGGTALAALKSIAADNYNTCGIWSDDSVKCWGRDYSSTISSTFSPTSPHITPITRNSQPLLAKQITGGGDHFCAIALDDTLYCWGQNTYGNRGDGTTTTPFLASATQSRISASQILQNVQAVRAGDRHTCAYTQNQLYCWGGNNFGQVGDGSITQRNFATAITLPPNSNVTDFSLGYYHTCLSTENNIYCWGGNDFGQLGTTGASQVTTPGPAVLNATGAENIFLGSSSSCSSLSGQVHCWGVNQHGQLGHPQNFGNVNANPTPLSVNFQ